MLAFWASSKNRCGLLWGSIRQMGPKHGPFFQVFAAFMGSKKHGNLEIRKHLNHPVNRPKMHVAESMFLIICFLLEEKCTSHTCNYFPKWASIFRRCFSTTCGTFSLQKIWPREHGFGVFVCRCEMCKKLLVLLRILRREYVSSK